MDENILVNRSGWLCFKNKYFKCSIGSAGLSKCKHEGDKTTPVGTFKLRNGLYRADRIPKPISVIEFNKINENDGWCDDPKDILYNKRVSLPCAASHELLWRKDQLYDLIVVIGFNDKPIIANRGSAVFLHIAEPNYKATRGCVAVSYENLLELLADITVETHLTISLKD
ncbi:MAG: hypothetical protein CFH06_00011 [Alphaproteobacteria bacterium MarineAlpha3_Bin5]|nr:transpeptidase [Magnetovibrio sp.]PPR80190.1 MAG: hypothetical protein CFH06_00011 [Alphaproteobacteria bacterium MarineAlpha3_Bin5]|tara:strand:+ start:128 stop:637 length:510 start_codon:yes stop_codon:yes gene_type:complete